MIQKSIIYNHRFSKYYPKYDVKDKTLYLKGKVPIITLMEIKLLRKAYRLDIQNIIIK